MPTHYQTLGVNEQATPDEIRRAYRQLALRTHPDRTTDPAAHQQFIGFTEAYDVLSDPARRRGYDALLLALRQSAAPRPQPIGPRPATPHQPRPTTSRAVRLPIDLRAYQQPIRWWGRLLAVLALLVLLDYTLLQHTVPAPLQGTDSGRDGRSIAYTDFYTSHGTFRTYSYQQLPPAYLQVRTSRVLRLVSAVALPDGSPLPTQLPHRSLFGFTALLLALALLLQHTGLRDITRVNVGLIATFVGVILLLSILR